MALLRQTHRCLLHQHRNFSASAVSQTWFGNVEQAPKDPILGITEAFLADENPNKMNLGVVWLKPCTLSTINQRHWLGLPHNASANHITTLLAGCISGWQRQASGAGGCQGSRTPCWRQPLHGVRHKPPRSCCTPDQKAWQAQCNLSMWLLAACQSMHLAEWRGIDSES